MLLRANAKGQSLLTTSSMVKIGMLSGLGVILILLNFPLPIFPAFLKIDLSDAPALVGTFYMGPAAGVLIQLLKNILKFIIDNNTGGVGELANFLVGTAYVVPLGLIFQKNQSRAAVLWGSVLSILSMTITAAVLNYYVFIPAFAWVLGYPVSAFVDMAAKVNSSIVDLRTLILYGIVPFNLFKSTIISVVGYGLFRALQPLWKFK